ncbi:MAG: GNAT family N-acetyltransferase [Planctomycetia bacterium]|nr:GNAT family N-acetyltransferase [Planctomycetia bacterium]
MLIRPYRTEDLPALKAITVAAFEGVSIDQGIERLFGPINGRDWRWRKGRHLDMDAARDSDGIFVAEIDGRVVGGITTWQDLDGGIGHIPNLAVEADFRGQGIGRQLIEHALDHFRRHGLSHAKIETLSQNSVGQHLYSSLGFREVARQIHLVTELQHGTEATSCVSP